MKFVVVTIQIKAVEQSFSFAPIVLSVNLRNCPVCTLELLKVRMFLQCHVEKNIISITDMLNVQ